MTNGVVTIKGSTSAFGLHLGKTEARLRYVLLSIGKDSIVQDTAALVIGYSSRSPGTHPLVGRKNSNLDIDLLANYASRRQPQRLGFLNLNIKTMSPDPCSTKDINGRVPVVWALYSKTDDWPKVCNCDLRASCSCQ